MDFGEDRGTDLGPVSIKPSRNSLATLAAFIAEVEVQVLVK
jgi:hypothetical protein